MYWMVERRGLLPSGAAPLEHTGDAATLGERWNGVRRLQE